MPALRMPLSSALGPRSGGRLRDLLTLGATAAVPLAIALAIAVRVPNPNLLILAAVVLGALGFMALAVSSRYEVTLTLLALYLGTLDGVVKLGSGVQATSSIRDVLIGAISLGAILRLLARREPIRLPPLSGWVIVFVILVLVEVANPNTRGLSKIGAGLKQHLEWVPFFFFGYLLMRSKDRFRKLFLLLGVIALANGVVSTVQTSLSPAALARWGPGYQQRIFGGDGLSVRVYTDSSGKIRVRPPALGSDFGFGGYVGVLALPCALALIAIGGLRGRSLIALLLFAGALLAVATSLQREAVLGGAFALIAFALLSLSVGRRVLRSLTALLTVSVIAIIVISVLSAHSANGVFSRYANISPNKAASTAYNYRVGDLAQIPSDITHFPFGAGLASEGAGALFGGVATAKVNGQSVSGETQYNFVTLELGLPGLLLWLALTIKIIVLVIRRIKRIEDVELRLSLAGVFAALIAFTVMGVGNPTMSSLPFGPFFWFAVGIAAYWFGDGRARQLEQP
jgi:hypothetical protein